MNDLVVLCAIAGDYCDGCSCHISGGPCIHCSEHLMERVLVRKSRITWVTECDTHGTWLSQHWSDAIRFANDHVIEHAEETL